MVTSVIHIVIKNIKCILFMLERVYHIQKNTINTAVNIARYDLTDSLKT